MIIEQEVTMPNDGQNVNVKQKVDSRQSSGNTPTSTTPNASSTQSDAEKVFELEKQLHEQYAINNNAHTSSFISFLVSLLALFGAFGYVFVETPPYQNHNYDLEVFLYLAPIVSGILLFLSALCIQIGWSQRRDHIVIEKFRIKYGMKNLFNPTSEKNYWNFLPDYYNMFFWLFIAAQITVMLFTIIKICDNCPCGNISEACSCSLAITSIIFQIIFTIAPFIIRIIYFSKYVSFSKKQNDNESEQ
ncbi:MAG: hypothetical protein J6W84_05705 [Bacteroidales bacterium]|nr:hypothetical protein [Bacteroidales bacterium]